MPYYKVVSDLDENVTMEFTADNDYDALKEALRLCDSHAVRCPIIGEHSNREAAL